VSVRRRFVWRRKNGHAGVAVESGDGRQLTVRIGDRETVVDHAKLPGGRSTVILPSGRQLTGRTLPHPGSGIEAWNGARRIRLELVDPLEDLAAESRHSPAGGMQVRAQIPGRVVEVRVAAGDPVAAGDTLLVLEAMKMQNEIRADVPGRVVAVECSSGQTVETGALLVRLEPESGE
jgi:acetyl/propionyl-CoA carboxylase alpha subunit